MVYNPAETLEYWSQKFQQDATFTDRFNQFTDKFQIFLYKFFITVNIHLLFADLL